MKKNIHKFSAMILSLSLIICGCALSDNSSKTATEDVSDSSTLVSSEADDSSSSSSSIVVYDDLAEPDWEELSENSSSSASAFYSADSTDTTASESPYPIDDNLVMVFFGDSQIANGRNNGSDIPSLVMYRTPFSTSINLGIGGTTAAIELSTSDITDYENWTSKCFYGMVLALEGTVDRNKLLADYPEVLDNMNKINPSEVDYYFIEYGANDFFTKIPLDKYGTDGQINELHTYYGALSRGIEKLQEMSPNAKIILMTPFYGIYKDSMGTYLGDSYITSNGIGTLADYAKKMNNIAEEKQLYIFDGMFRSKHDLYLDTVDQYLMDTTHLSLLGRQAFGRLLAHIPNTMQHYEPSAYRQCDVITISNFDPNEVYRMDDESLKQNFPEEYESYLRGEYILVKPE